jgi:heat shock protein HslJ
LIFDKSKKGYSGFAGCNGFSGTYKASAPDNFSFGATAATKKYCMESSTLENNIFSAMQKVKEFVILENGNLLLRGDGVKLEYKKAI